MMTNWSIPGVLAGGICVLAIYSFLYKENPFYRFFEHVFIGISAGYGVVVYVQYYVWPDFLQKTFGLNLAPWESYNPAELLMMLPFIYGMCILFMLSRRHAWIARLVIGAGLGFSAGMAFKGFFAQFLPLVVDSCRPLVAYHPESGALDLKTMAEHLLFVVTLVCVMTYFFFSFEHDKPVIKQASAAGRYLMMVTFGAFFGATVMARMALLIDRLQFLTEDWVRGIGEFLTLMFGG